MWIVIYTRSRGRGPVHVHARQSVSSCCYCELGQSQTKKKKRPTRDSPDGRQGDYRQAKLVLKIDLDVEGR